MFESKFNNENNTTTDSAEVVESTKVESVKTSVKKAKAAEKREKLLEKKRKAEEKLKLELKKQEELLKEVEAEVDLEIAKIVRNAVKESKNLGDISEDILSLF